MATVLVISILFNVFLVCLHFKTKEEADLYYKKLMEKPRSPAWDRKDP